MQQDKDTSAYGLELRAIDAVEVKHRHAVAARRLGVPRLVVALHTRYRLQTSRGGRHLAPYPSYLKIPPHGH
jgi:hypothetical protein